MEQINQKKINKEMIGNACFYTALFMELVIVILDKSDYIIQYEGKYFQLTFLLFFVKATLTKYTDKEWITMFGFGLLGGISYVVTGRNEILRLVIMIAASKNLPLRKIMSYTFYTTLSGVLVLMALSMAGIFGKLYLFADFRGTGEELRYCFGLGHPNAFHCMLWALITLAIYLYFDKLKSYHFAVLMAINVGFYLFTDSKTGVIVATGTIALAALLRYVKKLRDGNGIYICGIMGFWGTIILSIIASTIGAKGKLLQTIDRLVTVRIQAAYLGYPSSNWSLFSSTENDFYQDMGYSRLFDWYGYIPALVFIAVVSIMIWDCAKYKKYKEYMLIMAFVVYTLFEAHAISVYLARNYMLMLLLGTWPLIFKLAGKTERYFWQMLQRRKDFESSKP